MELAQGVHVHAGRHNALQRLSQVAFGKLNARPSNSIALHVAEPADSLAHTNKWRSHSALRKGSLTDAGIGGTSGGHGRGECSNKM
eukprot:6444883-Alexandrium_andersonii.AAC.1